MLAPFRQFEAGVRALSGAAAQISARVLPDLEREFTSLCAAQSDSSAFEEMFRDAFSFSLGGKEDAIKSLIVVAMPSPPGLIRWETKTGFALTLLPPIYANRDRDMCRLKDLSRACFDAAGYRTYPLVLPKKRLCAAVGFGKYGRNHLLYVPGMGSALRLTVFGSDLPCEEETKIADDLFLPRCKSCGVCQRSCPTRAIGNIGETLDVDRCLTYWNESEREWPAFLAPSVHHAIVGCVRCQERCPENAGVWSETILAEFTKAETDQILAGVPLKALSSETTDKILTLGLDRYYDVLRRNLTALLSSESGGGGRICDTISLT